MSKFIEKFEKHPHQVLFNEDNLLNIKSYNNTIILDLFDTLVSIVYQDLFTARTEGVKPVEVYIPVQNLEIFQTVNYEFNRLVSFMTGTEEWEIHFIQSTDQKKLLNTSSSYNKLIDFNSIALLSAGLDSMAGVSEEIRKDNNTLFINSYSRNETNLIRTLYNHFSDSNKFCIINVDKYPRRYDGEQTLHSNQRTRTLAFIANALIFSDFYNIEKVKIYENGIMSLNPTFDLRRGVTKTTHHKTLYYINDIFEKLGLNTKVTNPFKFMTKKEVVLSINEDFKEKIPMTRTCSKGNVIQLNRDNRNFGNHCGVCIACILRLISLHNEEINDVIYKVPKYSMVRDTRKSNDKNYSYHEKKSLIEYYTRYKKEIDEETIYDYLDGINSTYFEDEDFYEKITCMLNKFGTEIDSYISMVEYD